MIFRYADKPYLLNDVKASLERLDAEGTHFAQLKVDGYACYAVKDRQGETLSRFGQHRNLGDGLYLVTRRDASRGGPTDVPASEEIVEQVASLDLPDRSILLGEWMARRTKGELPETLFLFDVLWRDDHWMGQVPAWERWTRTRDLIRKAGLDGPVKAVRTVREGFMDLFNESIRLPWSEGVVVKRRRGTLKGDVDRAVKNAQMVKVKWRSGDNGRDVVYGPAKETGHEA